MFTPTPARVTMLYAKQVPPAGGDTMFANLYLAYDTLSDGMKAMIADLARQPSTTKRKNGPPPWRRPRPRGRPPSRPSTRSCASHPETGRKALYLCHAASRATSPA